MVTQVSCDRGLLLYRMAISPLLSSVGNDGGHLSSFLSVSDEVFLLSASDVGLLTRVWL